ncbi:LacI family DNA-binding transcriptional regulator [Qiania dongpingensis]|uniref:LacI family DNA-binding transcriptional regulator n=1 Tax=Qiania dongpingensis TaxID=2763669 RepID=A0A7G9G3U2_9FIRM|nr:LacI family DNA-binding transcriptional regulator [Qiania dongpingensis]QNM05474.1 LacI family DNA-binding transcriptional regulator [Qiania dongpingensis]
MEKKITIKRIAELAGVSVATVSRVINQNGRYSAETESKVREIIETYHYVPNLPAKELKTRRTDVVGIIVPDILSRHFAGLVLEIQMEMFKYSYSTLICNTNEDERLEKRHVDTLLAHQVSGILFISGSRIHTEIEDMPVAYLDRRPEGYEGQKEIVLIESDNESGGYQAAGKLVERGCRRIAVLRDKGNDWNKEARYRGYCRAMAEAGRPLDMELAFYADSVSAEASRKAVGRALEAGIFFDGIMCTTDELAAGAVMALRERGRKVPEDVMVTGFDDTPLAAIYEPALTSVHQDVKQMAGIAAKEMLELIEGKTAGGCHRVIPVRLTERESTEKRRE